MGDAEMDRRSASSSRACWPRPTTTRALATVKGEVEQLCRTFPLYPDRWPRSARGGTPSPTTARWRARFRSSNRAPASATWRPRSPTRLDEGGVLLAEAGTGTGKTLAYLVPAILSGQRVLVSTGTKNLQEQIYFKDVPVLREALGVPFTATCMKGRGELSLPAPARPSTAAARQREGRRPARRRRDLPADHRASGRRETETGDRAELGGSARGPGAVARGLGHRRDLPRQRLPAVQRVLRHADAAARRRVRRRDRQPPPAVRRRRGARRAPTAR